MTSSIRTLSAGKTEWNPEYDQTGDVGRRPLRLRDRSAVPALAEKLRQMFRQRIKLETYGRL
ncbi:MAG: hypothetical protein KDA91_00825 [Planctomycetaceae bacterium]|nr:hypothetical protein [Planctomycetaceae bacterium]